MPKSICGSLATLAVIGSIVYSGSAQAVAVPGMGTWESTLFARDVDGDGTTDAYYDSALNVTWLDNPKGGRQVWPKALEWVAALDIGGVTGWRMPATFDPVCRLSGPGYNCGSQPGPNSSELAHLYYVTLGNVGSPSPGYGLVNGGPFTRLTEDLQVIQEWWSGTEGFYEFPVSDRFAWRFDFTTGGAAPYGITSDIRGVFAVRDGDVAAIPEPTSTALMLVAGLSLFFLLLRRGSKPVPGAA